MISLTSLFCHRLIQNSFQVTCTTVQSGNALAATKGTSIWVLAPLACQAAAELSRQCPQIAVLAIPPNAPLTRKERDL